MPSIQGIRGHCQPESPCQLCRDPVTSQAPEPITAPHYSTHSPCRWAKRRTIISTDESTADPEQNAQFPCRTTAIFRVGRKSLEQKSGRYTTLCTFRGDTRCHTFQNSNFFPDIDHSTEKPKTRIEPNQNRNGKPNQNRTDFQNRFHNTSEK